MIIIGIAGGTGSGKSTVVSKILESTITHGEVSLVPQDSYYKRAPEGMSIDELRKINYDHPDAFDWELLVSHIRELRAGRAIEQPTYSFLTCDRLKETIQVKPSKVIVVEGIMALYKKELRDLMDVKLFVDTDADERLIRVITRDTQERGRTAEVVMERYMRVLRPMHRQFIEPMKEYADLIIPQGGENFKAIEIIRIYIEKMLRRQTVE